MAPFYQNGLRFQCTQCGMCCLFSEGVVYLNEEEARQLADFLELPLTEFYQQYTEVESSTGLRVLQSTPSGACVFYQEGKCSVYSVRPLQCRTYPFWPENLTSAYQWKQTARECPGIGQGPIIPLKTIENHRQEQIAHDRELIQQSKLLSK